jgi:hypothetical protein
MLVAEHAISKVSAPKEFWEIESELPLAYIDDPET